MSNFIQFNLETWPVLLLDITRPPADDNEWLQYEADMLEVYSVKEQFSIILNIHSPVPWRYVLLQGMFMKAHVELSEQYLKHISVFVKTVTANALLTAFLQIHKPIMPVEIHYAQ